jgi:RIO kinase 1
MAFVGDAGGPAPLLHHVRPSPSEARELFDQLLRNIEIWLGCGRIHGDLSAYNILYYQQRLVIIDFPQAVDPSVNPHAYDLLLRDVTNVCGYFRRLGVTANPQRITDDLWMRWRFGGSSWGMQA